MSVDRSKFKTLSATKAKEKDTELDAQLGKKGSRTGFINLKDGKNYVRFYPPHPRDDDQEAPYALPKVTVFLPLEINERDQQGNEVLENGKPKKKVINRPVFNSKIHGGTAKDLVEEYIRFTVEKAKEVYSDTDPKEKAEKQRIMQLVYGDYKKQIQPITYSTTWVAYADIVTLKGNEISSKEFGRLEIKKSVKERLNQIAISTEDDSEPVSTDPFTDLDNGRLAVITYNKSAEKANLYYTTEIDAAQVKVDIGGGRSVPTNRVFPLLDEDLDKLLAQDSLEKLYVGTFRRKDFTAQLTSLEFFDKLNKINTFQYDEWEKIMLEIGAYYPEEDDEEEAEEQQAAQDEVQDEFSGMSRDKLKAFNKANDLQIIVKTSMSDEDIRNAIRAKMDVEPEPEEEPEVEAEVEAEVEEPEEEQEQEGNPEPEEEEASTGGTSSRISDLKARLRNRES